MDIRKVKKLIELLEESNVAEIEIREGEETVRISRNYPQGQQGAPMPPSVEPQGPFDRVEVAVRAEDALGAR